MQILPGKLNNFLKPVNFIPPRDIKPALIRLICILSLLFNAGKTQAIQQIDFDKQLERTYQIRTSDVETFNKSLIELESNFQYLSKRQINYLRVLKGYQFWYQGNIKKATEQFKDVLNNATDKELQYKATLSLIGLSSFDKNWLYGFKLLKKISMEKDKIKNKELRHLGLVVASNFYNELEQYNMTKIYTRRLLDDHVSGRNLCLTLSLKIKAELSTSYIDSLEQEIVEAIQTCHKINEIIPENVLRTYLATYYLKTNLPQKAINLLGSYLSEINQTHYQLLINEASSILSQAYLKIDDTENAKKHALIVINNIETKDYLKAYINANKVLSSIAKKQGAFEVAYKYQQKYIGAQELLFKQSIARQLAVESAKHHAIERDNQIQLLNKQKKITELELISQRHQILVWGTGLISFVILVAFWFYRRVTRKKLHLQNQVNLELKELDKLKDTILTNTSHELRTPLNGIIGLSDLIILEYEDKIDDDLIRSIKLIANSGAKLALIVNDLLDLAQLKSGRIVLNYQVFDVSVLINDVIRLCRPLLKTSLVKITFVEKNNLSICQDLNRIQQVLFNLVGNAIKFTESGEINISCELRSEFLWFHISDTGIGIPNDKIERVFKGFEQVDNSNSKTHEGSGLGLAICLETVTLLGGKINLRSELGKGTIVSFYVPVLTQDENTSVHLYP